MTEETKPESADNSLQTTPLPLIFTPDLYAKLSILAVNRRTTRKEFQNRLGVSNTQVSKDVSKLEHLGLIKRCYETPEDYHIVSIELTPAGEAALRTPAPLSQMEISSAVKGVLEAIKAGKLDRFTPEQLALPLKRAEVREILSYSIGGPFLETRLAYLIAREILKPMHSKKDSGNHFRYSLQSVLDLVEKLSAPKNTITFELAEVLEVLRIQGRDHLTQNHLELPIDTNGVIVLGMHVTGKPLQKHDTIRTLRTLEHVLSQLRRRKHCKEMFWTRCA